MSKEIQQPHDQITPAQLLDAVLEVVIEEAVAQQLEGSHLELGELASTASELREKLQQSAASGDAQALAELVTNIGNVDNRISTIKESTRNVPTKVAKDAATIVAGARETELGQQKLDRESLFSKLTKKLGFSRQKEQVETREIEDPTPQSKTQPASQGHATALRNLMATPDFRPPTAVRETKPEMPNIKDVDWEEFLSPHFSKKLAAAVQNALRRLADRGLYEQHKHQGPSRYYYDYPAILDELICITTEELAAHYNVAHGRSKLGPVLGAIAKVFDPDKDFPNPSDTRLAQIQTTLGEEEKNATPDEKRQFPKKSSLADRISKILYPEEKKPKSKTHKTEPVVADVSALQSAVDSTPRPTPTRVPQAPAAPKKEPRSIKFNTWPEKPEPKRLSSRSPKQVISYAANALVEFHEKSIANGYHGLNTTLPLRSVDLHNSQGVKSTYVDALIKAKLIRPLNGQRSKIPEFNFAHVIQTAWLKETNNGSHLKGKAGPNLLKAFERTLEQSLELAHRRISGDLKES